MDSATLTVPEQEARFSVNDEGRFSTTVKMTCIACDGLHSLRKCPFVFEDNPWRLDRTEYATREFEARLRKYPGFHDAVVYSRKWFSRDKNGLTAPVPRSKTQDAPPLAKVWLSNFDERIIYPGKKDGYHFDVSAFQRSKSRFSPGHYATTDDNGKPYLVVFANTADMDEMMSYEMDMIRSFVTSYNNGAKSLFNVSPELDVRPIGVVFVTKLFHISRLRNSLKTGGITVGIASEYSWFHGYARWGIHIKAKGSNLQNGYEGWTSGRVRDFRGNLGVDWHADTASKFENTAPWWVAAVNYALLRDVREPAERISGFIQSQQQWERILYWRKMLLHRAATFYGTSSPQYRLIYGHAQGKDNDVEGRADRNIPARDAMPLWKHILARTSMAGKPYEAQTIWRSIKQ